MRTRIRHKKCDETRPSCKNCTKTGRKCDYTALLIPGKTPPIPPPRRSSSTPKSRAHAVMNHPTGHTRPTAPLPAFHISQKDGYYFQYIRVLSYSKIANAFDNTLWLLLLRKLTLKKISWSKQSGEQLFWNTTYNHAHLRKKYLLTLLLSRDGHGRAMYTARRYWVGNVASDIRFHSPQSQRSFAPRDILLQHQALLKSCQSFERSSSHCKSCGHCHLGSLTPRELPVYRLRGICWQRRRCILAGLDPSFHCKRLPLIHGFAPHTVSSAPKAFFGNLADTYNRWKAVLN